MDTGISVEEDHAGLRWIIFGIYLVGEEPLPMKTIQIHQGGAFQSILFSGLICIRWECASQPARIDCWAYDGWLTRQSKKR